MSSSSSEESSGSEEEKKPTSSNKATADSESSETSDSEESEASVQNKNRSQQTRTKYQAESESDEDEGGRVVKSAREKALDQISRSSKELRQTLGQDDWPKIKELFEALNKLLTKHSRALAGSPTPEPYLEALIALEDEVKLFGEDQEAKKRVSQIRYKAWGAISFKLPKLLQPYRTEIEALRKKKETDQANDQTSKQVDKDEVSSTESSASSSSSSSSSSSETSSGTSSSDSETSSTESQPSDSDKSDSEEESSDFETESSESSESEEEGAVKRTGRDRWVKRTPVEKPQQKVAIPTPEETSEQKRLKKIQAAQKAREKRIAEEKERRAREAALILTQRDVERLINATASRLWRRDTNRRDLTEILRGHVSRAVPFGPVTLLPALMHLVSSQFDTKNLDDVMPLDRWRSAVSDLRYILRVLEKNPNLRLVPIPVEDFG